MKNVLLDYYRLPESWATVERFGEVCSKTGYFRFGDELVLYGEHAEGDVAPAGHNRLYDTQHLTRSKHGMVLLPFDPEAIVDNLRNERYNTPGHENKWKSAARKGAHDLYYFARPLLSVGMRRHLQKLYHRGWQDLRFPSWPVDTTVEILHQRLLSLSARATPELTVPFIWFWPEGASGCMIMTHDVETPDGRDFCSAVMDLDEEHGIKASFQVVPEQRYQVTESYLERIRSRGHEVNVQDLNHDGHLYDDPVEFLRRARKISQYVRDYRARGFRGGVLYRRQEWFDAFDFSYDMSVPNVAHLDPQKGGCCTVMPYYIGNILELPVTTTQDYQLFYILGQYSLDLWQRQVDLILDKNGLISFIIHPDYVIDPRNRSVFTDLLRYLAETCAARNVWKALPREVDQWWRNRNQMRLVQDGKDWRVEGPESQRARVAYATFDGDRVEYSIQPSVADKTPESEGRDRTRGEVASKSEGKGIAGAFSGAAVAWIALWEIEEIATTLLNLVAMNV